VAERDPLLRRVERHAVVACAAMALTAALVSRERVAAAAGVVAGGVLAAISYRGIKGGVDALVGGAGEGEKRAAVGGLGLVKFFTRYAILAAAAWVILARVRLPPVAVIAGASSLIVAVAVEAVRPRRGK
jgi:hypothetical protein